MRRMAFRHVLAVYSFSFADSTKERERQKKRKMHFLSTESRYTSRTRSPRRSHSLFLSFSLSLSLQWVASNDRCNNRRERRAPNKTLTIARGTRTHEFLATSILKSDSCPQVQGLITICLTLRTHGEQLNLSFFLLFLPFFFFTSRS